jgi:hypothetical protein
MPRTRKVPFTGEMMAAKWGVLDYRIQAWDEALGGWRTRVTERRDRAMAIRVHLPAKPVVTARFRIVVDRVSPLDGAARLLQLETWGRGSG